MKMRTEALITGLLTTALLTACDPGEPSELDEVQRVEADEPGVALDPADAFTAGPDAIEDQTCQTYYFATSANDTKKSQCMAATPVPQLPVVFPVWDDILNNELNAMASASCAAGGARNGLGQLPVPPGAGAPGGDGSVGGLVDPSAEGPTELGGGFDPKAAPVQPAVCQTVCESHGKLWDSGGAYFGTCAFNKVKVLQPPDHEMGGPVCLAPNTQRWQMGGGVLFDCGCRCV